MFGTRSYNDHKVPYNLKTQQSFGLKFLRWDSWGNAGE